MFGTRIYLTADHLARTFSVAVGTVYYWASVDGWDRTSPRHRPVRYSLADAQASFDRRHQENPILTA